MPNNQNIYKPRDDMHLLECDLKNNYKSCQPSEKFCRFAYASWCPVCDLEIHRRRSKSECIDVQNRKRSRDMKSQSPKFKNTSENMDYLELRTRLDYSKVRTNLCELPTTYINNCQTNVPSNATNVTGSTKFSNFIQPLRNDHQAHITRCSENSTSKDINFTKNGDILKDNVISKSSYSLPHITKQVQFDAEVKCPSLNYNEEIIKMREEKSYNSSKPSFMNELIDHPINKINNQNDSTTYPKKNLSPRLGSAPAKYSLPNHICREPPQTNNASCPRRHLPTPKSPIKPKNTMDISKSFSRNVTENNSPKSAKRPTSEINTSRLSSRNATEMNSPKSSKRHTSKVNASKAPVRNVTETNSPKSSKRHTSEINAAKPFSRNGIEINSPKSSKRHTSEIHTSRPSSRNATDSNSSKSPTHNSTKTNSGKLSRHLATRKASEIRERNISNKNGSLSANNTVEKEKINHANTAVESKRGIVQKEHTRRLKSAPESKKKIRRTSESDSFNTKKEDKYLNTALDPKRNFRQRSGSDSLYTHYSIIDNIIQKEENSDLKRTVSQRSESENSHEIANDKQTENCTVIPKKAREISPQENKKDLFRTKSAVKVASIKSRHKLSAIKLRKVRTKIAHSVSSDSNLSDSDYSESEIDVRIKRDVCKQCCDTFSAGDSDIISGCTPMSNTCIPVPVSTRVDNFEKWPLRSSLFPYVPPYILFSSHDSDPVCLPPGAARFLKWKLSTITPIIIRKTLTNTGFRMVRSEYNIKESNDWLGTWGKHLKSNAFQTLRDTQKLNHFPGTFQVGRKDRLWKNLQRLMYKYGQKEFGFIPRTFVLPHDLKSLRQAWEKSGTDKWIIKPPAAARGTGIKVIYRWANLPKKKSLVVQQYISNPYLINGSKFDLRLYVLVTSFNPLRIYLYPDGLARFASTKYSDDVSTLNDRYMHLTNYSINKFSSQYTANEDANACKGHKWTLSKLWEYLEKDGVNTKMLWRTLQQLVIKTFLCGESSITQLYKANINSRYNCYEIFGIDVLLDERLKPWLLEVNISPSLHSASPLDIHVKGPLVQSLLNLAQFHLPPKMSNLKKAPPCLNKDLYSVQLTTKERLKQMHFTQFEKREEYLYNILTDLTGDDVRHLIQAEDELTVAGNFERIFPTQHSYHYFQFMEVRYYNRLFDAWEFSYEKNRGLGVKLLQSLCETKIHLLVAPAPVKPALIEIERVTSPEETTSTDDSAHQTVLPIRQTSPLSITNSDLKSIRNDVRQKMLNLGLGSSRPITLI